VSALVPPPPAPQLSAALVTFAADAPDDWSAMRAMAGCYDRAGIDRLVVSDHVVFGEHLDEYGRPEVGGQRGGRQPTGPDGHWLVSDELAQGLAVHLPPEERTTFAPWYLAHDPGSTASFGSIGNFAAGLGASTNSFSPPSSSSGGGGGFSGGGGGGGGGGGIGAG
jgi:hypothetical protein